MFKNSSLLPILRYSLFIIFLSYFYGCAATPTRNPVPPDLTNQVGIKGVLDARSWGDEWPKFQRERFENVTIDELEKKYGTIYGKPHNYIAISGGGANGAFGAGLISGWTASGTRPEFTMVTGISTGALSAPFVFLGPEYDDQLKNVYTTTTTDKIIKRRAFLDAIFGDSVATTAPLKKMIGEYISTEVISAIAVEHKKGRRLFIGTLNLDAGRSVIWNIGAIAVSDHPDKENLIREILRASSAIPVAFPPVQIEVEKDGKRFDELHVDGGTGAQVFVYPAAVDWKQITEKLNVQGAPNVYVIRNAFLEPDYNGVQRRVLPIASRTIDSLIRTQGIGDLYQIFTLCKRDGNEFHLAYIPSDFEDEPKEAFDPEYMQKLFDIGYKMAVGGYPWYKYPPGFKTE